MKTTIEVSDELLMLAKRRALERGVTLKSLIEAGLRHALIEDERREAQPPYRLPVIRDALRLATPGDDDVNTLIDAIRETQSMPQNPERARS